ncbi:MAG: hypothetical protein JW913_19490 [Chitinispirillaceae bacterium]|nr:hypothetical protein [Chitinispirillaceae bacterium]
MNSDESLRNVHYSSNRKPIPPKNQVYSPSTNYNYNGNQSMHGNHGSYGNSNYGNPHNQRRKPNQFKRDNHGAGDRLAKQNDIIIRLLKEIRDRLPAPPVVPGEIAEPNQELNQETTEDTAASLQKMPMETAVEQGTPADGSVQAIPAVADVPDDELDEQVNGNL